MSIGFAAISTTLIINGNANVSENQDDFSVIFTAASIDCNDVYATAVDDTKTVDKGTFGTHTVHISNMSACESETSETACGFVVEFADIIEKKEFNKADKENEYRTNNGGWENSELRKYINTTLFDYFSGELKSVISSTKLVSGHGKIDAQNYQTYDNLYLLSIKEYMVIFHIQIILTMTPLLVHQDN